MFESDVIGDGERVKGGLCAFPCRCTAVHAHLRSSIIWKHSWCYPYELPFFIQFAFHHKALPNVRHPHPHMLCTTPGLCTPVAVPVCDNTTHHGTAVHTLNTCFQPVEGIYEYNYPSLVKLVYWLEGELGVSTPLYQTLRQLVQKSMAITFIDGRVIVCILPEVCLTSRGNLEEGRRKRRCSKCCNFTHPYNTFEVFPLFDHLVCKSKGEMVVKGRPGNQANFRLHGMGQLRMQGYCKVCCT